MSIYLLFWLFSKIQNMTVVFTYLDNYLITTMAVFGSFCQLLSKKYLRQISILGKVHIFCVFVKISYVLLRNSCALKNSRNKKAPVSLFRKLQHICTSILAWLKKHALLIICLVWGLLIYPKYSRLD